MSSFPKSRKRWNGFTLAELLIALGIMGIMATFAIPMVLNAAQKFEYSYRLQMAAAMVSSAYTRYKMDNQVTAATKLSDLTQYMNYVKIDTTTPISDYMGSNGNTTTCANATPCASLANGSKIWMYNWASFSSGALIPSSVLVFAVDPDGVRGESTTTGIGKTVEFYLYYSNGRVTSQGQIYAAGETVTSSDQSRTGAADPSWFTWN